jgi:hypothetical protein
LRGRTEECVVDRPHDFEPVPTPNISVATARCIGHFDLGHTDSWGSCPECIDRALDLDPAAAELLDGSRETRGWSRKAASQPAGFLDRTLVVRACGPMGAPTRDHVRRMVAGAWNGGRHMPTAMRTGEIKVLIHRDGEHGHRAMSGAPDDRKAFAVGCERCAEVAEAATAVLTRLMDAAVDPMQVMAENLESRKAIRNLVIEGRRAHRSDLDFRAKPNELPITIETALTAATDAERDGWSAADLHDVIVTLTYRVSEGEVVDLGDDEHPWEVIRRVCGTGRAGDLLWERLGRHLGDMPSPLVLQAVLALARRTRVKRPPARLLDEVVTSVFLDWVSEQIGVGDLDTAELVATPEFRALRDETRMWFRRLLKAGLLDDEPLDPTG